MRKRLVISLIIAVGFDPSLPPVIRRGARVALLLVGIAIARIAGCARTDAEHQRPRVETTDSAGVQLVRNLDSAADTQAIELTEEVRIGAADGPAEFQFHRINGIALDDQGRFFITDLGSLTVRVFDAAGRFVRRFGGPGRGPGEFVSIGGLFLWRDTVHLNNVEPSMPGVLFDTTGKLLVTYKSLLSDGTMIRPVAGGPNGWFFRDDSMFARLRINKAGDVTQNTTQVKWAPAHNLVLLSRSRAGADSLLTKVASHKGGRTFVRLGSEGGSDLGLLGYTPFFEPSSSRAIDGRGFVYIAHGWPYLIDVYDGAGQFVRRITRAHDSIPTTDVLVEEVLRRIKAHLDTTSDRGGSSLASYKIRAALPRIGFVPVTSTMYVSALGWLWVMRPDLEPDPAGLVWWPGLSTRSSVWDVFNPDGHFQHTVQLPPRFMLRAVTDSAAIGVMRDELDVEYVVRYAVRRRPSS